MTCAMISLRAIRAIVMVVMALIIAVPESAAQRFSVASFRTLPNDVSAFINPVRDLNDEDCGLVKVMGSEDFAFSTPLGIVKRVDNVGEVWLYLPRGSKKITIKHPKWGVLRDYLFPERIDSHMTYELKIDEPVTLSLESVGTMPIAAHTDTLVVTRVDTLVVQQQKKIVAFNVDALATFAYGGKSREALGGILLMALRRHGAFIHASTNFGAIGSTVGDCGRHGEIDGKLPFYSGLTRHSALLINGGAAHRLSDRLVIFEGLGYSSVAVGWELAPSEGGGYVKNDYYSVSDISFEAGVMVTLGRVAVSASAVTIKGKSWFGAVGVGIRLGK